MVVALFTKVANWDALSPITSDPEEWGDISAECSGEPMWQNKRCPRFFSNDGGKTWYDVNAKNVEAVQEAMAYGYFRKLDEGYEPGGREKQRWFTMTEQKYRYFYDMIYKHLPVDNQFAKDVLETIKRSNYRCSERQYNYLKDAVEGRTRPENYHLKH